MFASSTAILGCLEHTYKVYISVGVLPSEYIYVLGSWPVFNRYNIMKGTRSSLMPPLNSRYDPAVCLKGNNIVLCGGAEIDSCEVYSTELNV